MRPLLILATCGLLAPAAGRADRKELFVVVGYESAVNRYNMPAAGVGTATTYGGVIDLGSYYGFTNSMHVGGRLRLSSSSDVHFANATVLLPDGTKSEGDVYTDHRSLGLGALMLYRFDVGLLAPVFEVEAGFTSHQYRNVVRVPAGASYSRPLDDLSETLFHGSATVLVEYRLGNRWMVATGFGGQLEPNGLSPWSVFVPFRVGRVW